MSMEKNGAISADTPQPCCGGSCDSKSASADPSQLTKGFPETKEQADSVDQDLTKSAVDAVANASKSHK